MTRAAFAVGEPGSAALRAINYSREVETFRKPRRGLFTTVPLRSLLATFAESYWAVFTRIDCERVTGVQLLTQTDMFSAEPEGRIIRRDSMPRPEDHLVRRWQVLIAGAGQMNEGNLFGKSIIADNRLAGGYLGPHAAALGFQEPGSEANLWTYAFLNTQVGTRAVRSCAFGTSVPGLRLDLLAALPIPFPEQEGVLRRVAALVRRCVEQRETYQAELRKARDILLALPEMRAALEMCSDRRARCVVWDGQLPTFNAWNYAGAGDALAFLRRKWSARLGDFLQRDGIFKGGRNARVACDPPHGVDFFSQRDVFAIRAAPRRVQRLSTNDLEVTPDLLLLASRGQMNEGALFGRIERACHLPPSATVTEDITRLRPIPGAGSLLFAFLSTSLGTALLRTTAYGTSIPGMRVDLLRDLPVPDLTSSAFSTVALQVDRASVARVEASRTESEAIRIVDEEVLPAWLV